MSARTLRNIGSGFIAQAWSGLLGLIVLPILVRGLGPERYGLLALSLALIGFAAIADLGVGRAASKYLAEDYEKNETTQTARHISSALTISTVMGVAGSFVLLIGARFLADHVLRVPASLARETRVVLWVTSFGLLPVLWRITFDGALAGHHRITELSLGNMIANSIKAGLSVAAVRNGRSIVGVVLANVFVSYLHALGLGLYLRHYFRGRVLIRWGWDAKIARDLVRLGLMYSGTTFLAGVLLLYFDRFIIAAFLPLAALGYYSTAFDITSKQCYIANPIGQAFFPVFSGKAALGRVEFEKHYLRANRVQAICLGGLAAMLMALARPLLTYWISPEIALHSAPVMGVLTLAMLFSGYGILPYVAILVASGHPEVGPKIFIAAFAVHVFFSLLLIKTAGTLGVATAVLLAFVTAFFASCYWVSKHLLEHASLLFFFKHCFAASWGLAMAIGVLWWLVITPRLHSLAATLAAFIAGYGLYLGGCCRFACTREERDYAREMSRKALGMAAHTAAPAYSK